METGPEPHDAEARADAARATPDDAARAAERPRARSRADDLPAEVALDADLAPVLERAHRLRAARITSGAIAAFRELLAARPRESAWRLELADTLEGEGRREEALKELDRGLDLAPDEVPLLTARATLLTTLLRYERAEADLRRAVKLQSANVEALVALGSMAIKRGRWREGLEPLRRATDLAPENAAGWYYLGEVYHRLDQLVPALSAYERAVALEPQNARALKSVGNVLDRMNRPREAAAAHRRALEAARAEPRR